MLYFTGDMHGDMQRLSKQKVKKLKSSDTLIVCGDFGFIWDDSKQENKNLDKLSKLPFNICFVDGTHENFKLLSGYPVILWNGGAAHKIRNNIYHLMRGQLYDIDGKKIFTLGGGENPDLELKEDEEIIDRPEVPSKDEMLAGVSAIEKAGYKVDYIVTHEPPAKIGDFLMLSEKESSTVTALGAFLDELSAQTEYKKWFFGSLHIDKHISASMASVFTEMLPEE